ncbi:MAG: hypothetical protein PHN84_01110 [Desulfuromonadaceae bacterium]|nr:hypothetical protein [Desulfuromonadaceae bacterium]MDD2855063.1 hypothetical protein [Desulfuromonadaceae bacterium]
MVKNIDKAVTDDEGVSSAKLVFSDDALVVNYLNALLASAPSSITDSAEIQFVHIANGVPWKPATAMNGYSGNPIKYDSYPKNEAEDLRKENEHLKFRIELAEIDSQVLRSENNNLKAEIAAKIQQLDELQVCLDKVLNENIEFQSKIEELQIELDLSTADKINTSLLGFVGIRTNEDESHEEEVEPEQPEVCEPFESTEITDSPQETAVLEVEETVAFQTETEAPAMSAEPSIVSAPPEINYSSKAVYGIDEDTALISRPQPELERGVENKVQETVYVSKSEQVIGVAPKSSRSDSKILKPQDVSRLQSQLEIKGQPPKIEQERSYQESVKEQPPSLAELNMQESPTPLNTEVKGAEPVEQSEASSDLSSVTLNRDCTDEIDMEAAPDPKIVVKRNVKLYEDIQKVTDGTQPATDGRGIVL